MFNYPVDIKKDTNGTFLVTFPDISEAVTFGATRSEALFNAIDALETALSFYIEKGVALPKPSAKRGRITVRPTLKGSMKLGIYQAMRDDKVKKAELARRLGGTQVKVDRLLDLTHSSRIEELEAAFVALHRRVNVELEAAA